MSDKHILFSEWEAGDPLDEEHLAQCADCRREWELLRFLKHQTDSAPRIDAPPFFASRVARLAVSSTSVPLWGFLERAARRLTPVFAVLLLAVSYLIYTSSQEPQGSDEYVQILMEPQERADVSMDELVGFLRGPAEEGHIEEQ